MKEHYPAENIDKQPHKNIERFLVSDQFLKMISLGSEFALTHDTNVFFTVRKENNGLYWANNTSGAKNENDRKGDALFNIDIHSKEYPNIYLLPHEVTGFISSKSLTHAFISAGIKDEKMIASMLLLNKHPANNTEELTHRENGKSQIVQGDNLTTILSSITSDRYIITPTIVDLVESTNSRFDYIDENQRQKIYNMMNFNPKNNRQPIR
jgi:hypothetical protein